MGRMTRLTPMLQVSDLPKTIEFYTGTLGFTLKNLWPAETPVWCVLDRDNVEVMFTVNDHLGPPQMTGTLYIETSDVLDLHQALGTRVEVLWGPEVFPYGMREFAIRDCNGYTLSFGEPTDDPPTSESSPE